MHPPVDGGWSAVLFWLGECCWGISLPSPWRDSRDGCVALASWSGSSAPRWCTIWTGPGSWTSKSERLFSGVWSPGSFWHWSTFHAPHFGLSVLLSTQESSLVGVLYRMVSESQGDFPSLQYWRLPIVDLFTTWLKKKVETFSHLLDPLTLMGNPYRCIGPKVFCACSPASCSSQGDW